MFYRHEDFADHYEPDVPTFGMGMLAEEMTLAEREQTYGSGSEGTGADVGGWTPPVKNLVHQVVVQPDRPAPSGPMTVFAPGATAPEQPSVVTPVPQITKPIWQHDVANLLNLPCSAWQQHHWGNANLYSNMRQIPPNIRANIRAKMGQCRVRPAAPVRQITPGTPARGPITGVVAANIAAAKAAATVSAVSQAALQAARSVDVSTQEERRRALMEQIKGLPTSLDLPPATLTPLPVSTPGVPVKTPIKAASASSVIESDPAGERAAQKAIVGAGQKLGTGIMDSFKNWLTGGLKFGTKQAVMSVAMPQTFRSDAKAYIKEVGDDLKQRVAKKVVKHIVIPMVKQKVAKEYDALKAQIPEPPSGKEISDAISTLYEQGGIAGSELWDLARKPVDQWSTSAKQAVVGQVIGYAVPEKLPGIPQWQGEVPSVPGMISDVWGGAKDIYGGAVSASGQMLEAVTPEVPTQVTEAGRAIDKGISVLKVYGEGKKALANEVKPFQQAIRNVLPQFKPNAAGRINDPRDPEREARAGRENEELIKAKQTSKGLIALALALEVVPKKAVSGLITEHVVIEGRNIPVEPVRFGVEKIISGFQRKYDPAVLRALAWDMDRPDRSHAEKIRVYQEQGAPLVKEFYDDFVEIPINVTTHTAMGLAANVPPEVTEMRVEKTQAEREIAKWEKMVRHYESVGDEFSQDDAEAQLRTAKDVVASMDRRIAQFEPSKSIMADLLTKPGQNVRKVAIGGGW